MSEKGPAGGKWLDKVSGLAGKILRKSGDAEPEGEAEPELTVEQKRAVALNTLRTLLAGGKAAAGLAHYHKTVQACESWELPERELLQLTELICNEKLWHAAVPFLENYLQRFSRRVIQVRLKLAKILVEQQQRPTYAARILQELPREGLSEKEEKLRVTLVEKSQKMIDDGVLELEGRPW